ncbi:MAG: hypothetical protein ABII26_12505 [Pseudomonadota bacterium]
MKSLLWSSLLSVLVFFFFSGVKAEDYLSKADALFEQGGMEHYRQAIEWYIKALESNPADFETNWKCARAYREYGEKAKRQNVEGWKDICARYGKEGMKYAQRASEKEPIRVEGHYYYGLNVGIYSDGVSILTALAEGLKDKTKGSLEKAYELDKTFRDGGPILALGRFWAIIPWPFKDKKKALNYYREYQKTKVFVDKDEGKIYLADLLLELGGEENVEEAKALLEVVLQSEERYFSDWAKRLQERIEWKR